MACSNPLHINPKRIYDKSLKKYSSDPYIRPYLTFDGINNPDGCYSVPCGWCLNCRVDKTNQLTHRAEYEYINYGCGAFVTFTFDDYHLAPYMFVNSKTGQIEATLSKKCAREFLDRLKKLVIEDNKKTGFNPLCRKDFKYMLVGEYGEHGSAFDRCHYHALFFGLDFAYCERLFWRAWQFQGNIQVGAIKNGGIGYVLKYIDKQIFGNAAWFKYDYNHLQRPFQFHSSNFGFGLYKNQLKYINKNEGNYRWHGHDYPVPIYYKNRLRIMSGFNFDSQCKKYLKRKKEFYTLYNTKIKNYKDFVEKNLELANIRQRNLMVKLQQSGNKIADFNFMSKQMNDLIYHDNHRLPTLFDKDFCVVVDKNFNHKIKVDNRIKSHLTTRDLMKLHTDYNKLKKRFGFQIADSLIHDDKIPF